MPSTPSLTLSVTISAILGLLVLKPISAEPVVASDAKLQTLASGMAFTEGPAADAKGHVFFTDQPNDRIMKWSVAGELTTFLEPCGRANGMFFLADGTLITCSDAENELWAVQPNGAKVVLVKDFDGKRLNGPNDAWVTPEGGIYFTDPFYKRPYWTRGGKEQDGEHVYYLPPNRKGLIRVTDDLVQPNGIVGTADGKTLYVADIGAGKTYRYHIQSDGRLTEKTLFCSMGSDGMTLDVDGNLYLTGKGVTIFNRSGERIEHIEIPDGWTTNVCFGGTDGTTLFITAGGSLYSIRTTTRGLHHPFPQKK